MEEFVEVSRYLLPLIAIAIVAFCIPSMIKGNKQIGVTGYLHNGIDDTDIPLSGYEVSVGRSKVCDIILDYSTVSRFHAVLSKHKDGWRVTDTMSKTGTYINAKKIDKPCILKDGDTLVFGNAVFTFKTNDVIAPTQEPNMTQQNRQSGNQHAAVPVTESAQIFLIDANSNDAYRIDGLKTCMIGSGDDVQIKLNDQRISQRHAMLVFDNGVWSVTDMDSQFGTRLNGRPIGRLMPLKDFDTINICDTIFVFRVFAGGGANEK